MVQIQQSSTVGSNALQRNVLVKDKQQPGRLVQITERSVLATYDFAYVQVSKAEAQRYAQDKKITGKSLLVLVSRDAFFPEHYVEVDIPKNGDACFVKLDGRKLTIMVMAPLQVEKAPIPFGSIEPVVDHVFANLPP